jgi:hypothetical protein
VSRPDGLITFLAAAHRLRCAAAIRARPSGEIVWRLRFYCRPLRDFVSESLTQDTRLTRNNLGWTIAKSRSGRSGVRWNRGLAGGSLGPRLTTMPEGQTATNCPVVS